MSSHTQIRVLHDTAELVDLAEYDSAPTQPCTPIAQLAGRRADVLREHAENASRKILQALHYHRHFGQPNPGSPDELNKARAESNARRVATYAHEAGKLAAWSECLYVVWAVRYPQACAVPAIWDAFRLGWFAAQDAMAGEGV